MFKWKKLGCVFNPADYPNRPNWMHEFAQAPHALELNDCLRVYFNCRPKPNEHGQYVSYCGFVDLDKDNLFKVLRISEQPVLPLGQLGTFDEFGTYPFSVVAHHNELLGYYGGWTRCASVPFDVAIGVARSTDGGLTFKKLGDGPVLSYSLHEPFVISGPKIRQFNNQLYLFYIAGKEWLLVNNKPEPVYKIRLATSHNGLDWDKHNSNLITDLLGDNEAQASPDVIVENGLYHMFFCYRQPTDFRHNKARSYRIGYASSSDLMHWQRNDARCGLDISESGFDSDMLAYPHVFKLNGKTYLFYLGNQVGRYGFGLAELEGELTP